LVDALHRTRLTLDVYSCLVRSALDKRNAADPGGLQPGWLPPAQSSRSRG